MFCALFPVGTAYWCVPTPPSTSPQATKTLQRGLFHRYEAMDDLYSRLPSVSQTSSLSIFRQKVQFLFCPFTFHVAFTFPKSKCVIKHCHVSGKGDVLFKFPAVHRSKPWRRNQHFVAWQLKISVNNKTYRVKFSEAPTCFRSLRSICGNRLGV